MFSVTGTIDDSVATVTWADGGLVRFAEHMTAEDHAATKKANLNASLLEGRAVGPVTGPFTTRDHVSDPLSALFIIWDTFDDVQIAEGDVPEIPTDPDVADEVVY